MRAKIYHELAIDRGRELKSLRQNVRPLPTILDRFIIRLFLNFLQLSIGQNFELLTMQ